MIKHAKNQNIIPKNKELDQLIEELNKKFPISLKNIEHIVNNIHKKHPHLDKAEISITVLGTFQVIRDMLVSGKVINMSKIFFDMQLQLYPIDKKQAIKVKVGTPPNLKKYDRQ